MQTALSPTIAETDHGDVINYLDNSFIEQIWRDLDGQVTRERIHQIATEAEAEFRTATVTVFVPIFIRRRTREKLEMLIDEKGNQ